MIDFHCHILPNMDDGADFPGDAVRMAKVALEEGITAIVATPHYVERKYDNTREEILDQFFEFVELLKEKEVPLKIFPGCEIALTPEVPYWLESGRLLTINDSKLHVLLEPPFTGFNPSTLEEVLTYLLSKGVTPILAHPERCPYIIQNPDWLNNQVGHGILVQLNTQSITTAHEEEIRTTAEHFLRNDLVHVVGTDAHSPDRRPPLMQAARNRLLEIIGEAKTRELLIDNPRLILA